MFVPISDRIDLRNIKKFCGGSTTDWVRVSKIIPSCVLWSISKKYPSADGSYIPFKESNENKAKQLYGDNWCTLGGSNFKDVLDLGANYEGLPKLCRWHKV